MVLGIGSISMDGCALHRLNSLDNVLLGMKKRREHEVFQLDNSSTLETIQLLKASPCCLGLATV